MSLERQNTRQLIDPNRLRLKVLCYGIAGSGKTSWLAGAPNLGIAACETGHGKGLASIAGLGVDFCTPESYTEFDQVCSLVKPDWIKEKSSVALDSLTDMTATFVKDHALSFPRAKGDTPKRKAGVPELDDYGVMGEVTRRLLRKLIDSDKHVIATATLKIDKPDADTGQGQLLVCPNLPGALSLGSTAMFDLVLCFRARNVLRDKNDPKSRYMQHYVIAKGSDSLVAKCRHNNAAGKPSIPDEFVFDKETGEGSFDWVLKRIQAGYVEALAKAA